MSDKNESNKRRPYVKPVVKSIRLDADVLLAKGCKTSSGTAKGSRICHKTGACVNNAAGS